MRFRAVALVALGLVVQGASATATDQRAPLRDVSVIRVANYGTPSTIIGDRERVAAIVGELGQLRTKAWRRGDAKLSCYATLVLLSGTRTVALFRVAMEQVVERPQEKGKSSYSLAIGPDDLPRISKLLTEIPPAIDCK